MKICLLVVGQTNKNWIAQGEDEYIKRLKHYVSFETTVIPDLKKSKAVTGEQQKIKEGEQILSMLEASDVVVLLDERGTEMTSRDFAGFLQNYMLRGIKRLVFIIGGPYGFSKNVYDRGNAKMSLSKLTFPHDLIRVLFLEQLYRAFTILSNEPYHHD